MGRGLVVYGGSGYSVRNGLAGLPICCHPTLHTARGKQGASMMAMSNGQRGVVSERCQLASSNSRADGQLLQQQFCCTITQ